jgi:hypothetical protein
MKLFRVYLGLDTKGRLTLDQAREAALGLACDWFPHGHTIIEATGRWQQDNAPVTEPTIIVEVMTENKEQEAKVYKMAAAYKALAFQEAVMLTKTEIEGDFV